MRKQQAKKTARAGTQAANGEQASAAYRREYSIEQQSTLFIGVLANRDLAFFHKHPECTYLLRPYRRDEFGGWECLPSSTVVRVRRRGAEWYWGDRKVTA